VGLDTRTQDVDHSTPSPRPDWWCEAIAKKSGITPETRRNQVIITSTTGLRVNQATSRRSVSQALFGRCFSALSSMERANLRRVIVKARYLKHHTKLKQENRDAARARKLGVIAALGIPVACQRCGYDKYAGALDFHHRDPLTKKFLVGNRALSSAVEEARKCDLICANCHREIHGETPSPRGPSLKIDPLLQRYLEIQDEC